MARNSESRTGARSIEDEIPDYEEANNPQDPEIALDDIANLEEADPGIDPDMDLNVAAQVEVVGEIDDDDGLQALPHLQELNEEVMQHMMGQPDLGFHAIVDQVNGEVTQAFNPLYDILDLHEENSTNSNLSEAEFEDVDIGPEVCVEAPGVQDEGNEAMEVMNVEPEVNAEAPGGQDERIVALSNVLDEVNNLLQSMNIAPNECLDDVQKVENMELGLSETSKDDNVSAASLDEGNLALDEELDTDLDRALNYVLEVVNEAMGMNTAPNDCLDVVQETDDMALVVPETSNDNSDNASRASKDSVDRLIDSITDILHDFTLSSSEEGLNSSTNMDDVTQEQTEELGEVAMASNQNADEVAGVAQRIVDDVIEAAIQTLDEMSKESKKILDEVTETSEEKMDETASPSNDVAEELKESTDEKPEVPSPEESPESAKLDESPEAADLDKISEELQKNLNETSQESLDMVTEPPRDEVTETSEEKMDETAEVINDVAEESMESTDENPEVSNPEEMPESAKLDEIPEALEMNVDETSHESLDKDTEPLRDFSAGVTGADSGLSDEGTDSHSDNLEEVTEKKSERFTVFH